MADLNLTGQQNDANTIQPYINALKNRLLDRKTYWDRCTIVQKKNWATSDKDPIMSQAWIIYKWLNDNFFEEYHEYTR